MNIHWGNNFNRNGNNHLDVVTVLKNISFFNTLKRSELRELSRIIYVRWFKKNEIIFSENSPGLGMYFIHKGSVKIIKDTELNDQEQLSTLTEGDFFGEISLMEERPRSESAIALEECCLLGIFRPELLRLIERKPRLGNKIILILAQLISARLHQKNEELLQIKEKLTNLNFIR